MAISGNEASHSSNGRSAIDDPASPYFLHHSDNPGLVLVSQLLTGDNYASWSRAMIIALSVKNKLGFIDGSVTKPDTTNLFLLSSWTRNNNVVISWILNSVSKEISASIIFADSALEIWNDLKDRFQQSNGPRIFQLKRDLLNLRQHQESVSVYFTKLKALWEELGNYRPACTCGKCTCGGVKELNAHYQMEYIMSFLMGLNESFASVRGQLLLMDPLPPINKAFSLISQEERQRSIGSQSSALSDISNTMAFALKSHGSAPHTTSGSNKAPKKDRPYCSKCNYHGHTIDTCYKIHGYPPGYRQKQRHPNSPCPSQALAHQVSTHSTTNSPAHASSGSLGNLFQNLSPTHCQQLLALLTTQLSSAMTAQDQPESTTTSVQTGFMPHDNDWQG